MDDKQTRILKEMHFRTGGILGSPFNPNMFQQGSGFNEKEFADFLRSLKSEGFIQEYGGSSGRDVMLTQQALDWIEGEFNGENERKIVKFLEALSAESNGNEIKIDNYVLKLGESVGLKKNEIIKLIPSLQDKGYIHLNMIGSDSFISVSQIGRKWIEDQRSLDSQSDEKTTKTPFKVFISHIHENEEVAKKLKKFLKSNFPDEIEIFVSGDPHNIPAGQKWFDTIIDAVRQCNYMIILCSPKSVERKWIHFEAGAAAGLDRKIIPLCFAGLSPGQLPSPLDQIQLQAIDSEDADKFQQHFEILMGEISKYIQVDRPLLNVLESEFYQELRISRVGTRGLRVLPKVIKR
jgi:hypothetical protein